jgi:hypothetical protein
MIHARKDYDERIQDSANLIPADEPVFLLRGQDEFGGDVAEYWANLYAYKYGSESPVAKAVFAHADKMKDWPVKKQPDTPEEMLK